MRCAQAALGGRDAAGGANDFAVSGGADANGAVKVVDGPAATAGAGLVYVCNLCDITATSPENLDAHFRGANHRSVPCDLLVRHVCSRNLTLLVPCSAWPPSPLPCCLDQSHATPFLAMLGLRQRCLVVWVAAGFHADQLTCHM